VITFHVDGVADEYEAPMVCSERLVGYRDFEIEKVSD